MILKLQLQNSEPTTVKIFSIDGTLQKQLQVKQSYNSINLNFLSKGTYLLAFSNTLRRFTTKLTI